MRAHRGGKEDGVFVIEASRIKRSFVANRTEGWKVSSFVRFSFYSFLFPLTTKLRILGGRAKQWELDSKSPLFTPELSTKR